MFEFDLISYFSLKTKQKALIKLLIKTKKFFYHTIISSRIKQTTPKPIAPPLIAESSL